MATKEAKRVTVTIPAAYLKDARIAVIAEIKDDGGALHAHQDVLARADRPSDVKILSRNLGLLEQLLDATGDTKVTAVSDNTSNPVCEMLQKVVEVLSDRLKDVCQYGPLPMGDALDIAARLRWAADEAIRLEPSLDHRLTLQDQLGREAA
jgi:hypothetical protein